MAAVVATHYNPDIKAQKYERLKRPKARAKYQL
jgi:hypothetical protein